MALGNGPQAYFVVKAQMTRRGVYRTEQVLCYVRLQVRRSTKARPSPSPVHSVIVSSVHIAPSDLKISQLRNTADLPVLKSIRQLNALFLGPG